MIYPPFLQQSVDLPFSTILPFFEIFPEERKKVRMKMRKMTQ
jgi:hypothetical protein